LFGGLGGVARAAGTGNDGEAAEAEVLARTKPTTTNNLQHHQRPRAASFALFERARRASAQRKRTPGAREERTF
jgi:hypothetical protein